MKFTIFTLFLLGSLLSMVSCQTNTPRMVIDDFNGALKKKDKTTLIPFLTNEPAYVEKRSFDEYKRLYNLPMSKPVPKKTEDGKHTVYLDSSINKSSGIELVNKVVSADLFFKQNRSFTKILSIREHGDEALAKVEMAGFSSTNDDEYAPLIYDVLLVKENDQWKIFKMNQRGPNDAQFYTYEFYANPDYNKIRQNVTS